MKSKTCRISLSALAVLGSGLSCSSEDPAVQPVTQGQATSGTTTGSMGTTSTQGTTATVRGTSGSVTSTTLGTTTSPTTTSAASVASSTGTTTSTSSVSSTGQAATVTGTSTTGQGFGGTTGVGGASSGVTETSAGTTDSTSATGAGGTSSVSTTTGEVTTTGGQVMDAKPSAGCSNGNSSPSLNLPANTLVSLPAGYDGSTPVPVVMAFHAAGNPNTQLKDRLGDDLGDKYLMLYPKSDGSGWNDATDGPKVNAMFTALTSQACIDENRVFATGHSSGAQFIVQRLCAGETRWRAVAPVASSVYCNSWDPVPALVIHGIGDQERSWDPNGEQDIVPYRTSNSCQASSTPYSVPGCSSSGTQVDPNCVEFAGCSEQTIWCQHNDPQYGTSHHGIPCFADSLIPQFFDSF